MRKSPDYLRRATTRYNDAIVINHDIDIAFILFWGLYGMWGIMTAVVNQSVLREQFEFYPILWGGTIGLLASIGCVAATLGFFVQLKDYTKRIILKKVEAYSIGLMTGFLFAYPLIMWANVVNPTADSSPARLDIAILSLSYLIFPMWRVKHLLARMSQLRLIRQELTSDGL